MPEQRPASPVIGEGTSVTLRGQPWAVGRMLGEGGQGAVFELRPADGGPAPLALKWYAPRSATAHQREAIARLIQRGSPGAAFLWPETLVQGEGGEFGYTMPLRPAGVRSVSDLLLGRVEAPPSRVLTLCIELAHAFLALHSEGLCYRDISFGNVFFDPASGSPLICDNDNVGVDGDSYSAVLGTRKFMAPEVIRGDAAPSAQTDLHSLAVLLFYLLVVHHPLLGRRELEHRGRDGETFLLGTAPLFIFDPDDDSNRPDPLTQPAPLARWRGYPRHVQALFEQTFTVGLSRPGRRVVESVWRAALSRLRDEIVVCRFCQAENLTERGLLDACGQCRRRADPAVRLIGDRGVLVLNAGTRILGHHVRRDYDFRTELGEVVYDSERRRWGVRNVGSRPWRLTLEGRPSVQVEPGRTTALVDRAALVIEGSRFVVDAEGRR